MYNRLRHNVRTNVGRLQQRGSFAQNFAIAFSGTAAVAALGLLVTPIMSRIYPPASYGLFAVFNSLVNNVNLISSLGYTTAFLLPRLHKRFLALVQFSLVMTVATFFVSGIAVLALKEPLLHLLRAEEMGNWLYCVPVTVFMFNVYLIMHAWYLRTKNFGKRAKVEVGTALAGRGLTLGYGWLAHGPVGGLIVGDIFAKAMGFFSLLLGGFYRHLGELYRTFSWRRIRAVAWEYREYPFYVLPTSYLNVLAAQLPIFFLTSGFGATTVGLYAFSTSLLELPINLIGNAISPVFMQKAAETYQQEPEKLPGLCLALYYKLFYFGLLPFGIISVFGDWIFKFAFGARWEMAGLFTAYLGYYYMFKLGTYATSPVYMLLQRQRLALLGTVLLVVARAASLFIGIRTHNLTLGMQLFGVSSLVVTFGVDMNILHLLKISVWRVAARSLALMGATLAVLWGLRLGLQHVFAV